jgi:two-component system, NtrC family, response regulator AtoC
MSQHRIMIVEDERITAEDIQEILTHLGYIVTAVVSTGADAIREAERTRPDLVMMDIRIKGDIDGIETAREIRERFDIPAVYLTAHADRETLERAKLAEPLGYLVKPFQEAELQASIEMALHKQKADRLVKQKGEMVAAAVRSMGEGLIVTNPEAMITLMNPAAETWTGWKHADTRKVHIDQVMQLKGRDRASASIARAIRTDALVEFPSGSVLVNQQGELHRIGGTVSPIRDHNGRNTGATVIFGPEKGPPEEEPALAVEEPPPDARFEMIGPSPEMQRLMHFARRIAASEVSTILLRGESGSGKDVVAKYLHYHSRRESQPFLAINCAAIPETLLESELFGYEKGAFTDARAQKKGILEMATGGTVFLDEIGEMPLALQAKMLRVLEDQIIRRLGGTADIQVDLRVINATNRDLTQAIQQGRFRLDLYYRLNVIQIVVPPLREHREDILPLANYFIGLYNRKFKRNVEGISPEGAYALTSHDWPGNIRELRNAIERAMVLEESARIGPASLGLLSSQREPEAAEPIRNRTSVAAGMSLEEAEKSMVLNALQATGWNQTRAAELLSITRDTLRYKMKKFNLRPANVGESGGITGLE